MVFKRVELIFCTGTIMHYVCRDEKKTENATVKIIYNKIHIHSKFIIMCNNTIISPIANYLPCI